MHSQIFSTNRICTGLFAALIAATPMSADEDPPNESMTSIGISVVDPQGGLDDRSGTGFAASLSWEWVLKKKHGLRATLEYAKFSDKKYYDHPHDPGVAIKEYDGSANSRLAMLDYIYRFVSHYKGLYISLGTGYGYTSVKPDSDGWGQSISGDGFCLSAGVGYNFTKNFGLDVSAIQATTYNPSGTGLSIYCWYQVSLKYRFSMQDDK